MQLAYHNGLRLVGNSLRYYLLAYEKQFENEFSENVDKKRGSLIAELKKRELLLLEKHWIWQARKACHLNLFDDPENSSIILRLNERLNLNSIDTFICRFFVQGVY